MGRIDGTSRDNSRPAGVADAFQVSEHSVEPILSNRCRNLLSHDDIGPAGTNECEEDGPEVALVLLACAIGVWSFQRLPIDATPDITNIQIQINTEAPGYSPLEAEQRITFPVETAIAGVPGLSYTRSVSRYGLSQVTVVFEDGTDIYRARQLVNERLQEARERSPFF